MTYAAGQAVLQDRAGQMLRLFRHPASGWKILDLSTPPRDQADTRTWVSTLAKAFDLEIEDAVHAWRYVRAADPTASPAQIGFAFFNAQTEARGEEG